MMNSTQLFGGGNPAGNPGGAGGNVPQPSRSNTLKGGSEDILSKISGVAREVSTLVHNGGDLEMLKNADEAITHRIQFVNKILSNQINVLRVVLRQPASSITERDVINISNIILDDEAIDIWTDLVGKNKYSIHYQLFCMKILQYDSEQQKFDFNDEIFKELATYFFDPEDKTMMVTAYKFSYFVQCFGPGFSKALKTVKQNVSSAWFGGFIDFREASCALVQSKPGTFFLRFSRILPCSFAVVYKDIKSEEIKQSSITASTELVNHQTNKRHGGFVMAGIIYKSLKELVSTNYEKLVYVLDNMSDVANVKYFYCYISFQDAERYLLPEKSGTFLIRFSNSKPGALVAAYKSHQTNQIEQSIILSDDGYMFHKGQHKFNDLDSLVKANSNKLTFPYIRYPRKSKIPISISPSISHGSDSIIAKASDDYDPLPLQLKETVSDQLSNDCDTGIYDSVDVS